MWADAIRRRVLIVDDEAISRAISERFLRRLNAEVDTVESGLQALERVKAQAYDLLIVDLLMPEMDGLATLRALRATGCTAPIATLTVQSGAEVEMECLEAGFDAFMAKPITMDKLRALLALATRQPLVSSFAADPELHDLIDTLVASLPGRVSALQRALAVGDAQTLELLTRALAADASGIGFSCPADGARVLESVCRAEDPERQQEALRRLAQLCSRARGTHRRVAG